MGPGKDTHTPVHWGQVSGKAVGGPIDSTAQHSIDKCWTSLSVSLSLPLFESRTTLAVSREELDEGETVPHHVFN